LPSLTRSRYMPIYEQLNREKKLDNRKWVFQVMASAVGLTAVLAEVFCVLHYGDLATLSESLKEQQQTVRKTISQIGVIKRTFRE
jgi:hypothetical protein